MVHGEAALTEESKRQAKSSNAAVIRLLFGSKLGGQIPGTPPPPCETGPVSHTFKLPSPMSREF